MARKLLWDGLDASTRHHSPGSFRSTHLKTRGVNFISQQVSIPVSAQSDKWIAAEILRDEFIQAQESAIENTEVENAAEASIELFARFLNFVAQRLDTDPQSSPARTSLLVDALKHFTNSYLSQQDVHTFTSDFETDNRKAILTYYYSALAALEAKGVTDIPRAPISALLSAAAKGDASIYALFGGQGTNEVYLDELQALYDTYNPYVSSFLSTVTNDLLVPLAAESDDSTFYTHGLNIISWLSGAVPRPPLPYLASVPVSMPLIGLTQLTQYLVISRAANLTPGQLRERFAGATGHSQGLVSAVAISASTTPESFIQNSLKALKWLFYCGLRGQQHFPLLALEPSIVQDAIEGGEGAPSPMLSVIGLSLKDLESHISKTNKHLPQNSQLAVSLYNGPKAFVVNGPPRALYGLVTSLRKIRAPNGLDQSKTPFSQRKPVFSIRFLVVNVPYHSVYLKDATEDTINEDLEGEELWSPEELAIPVFRTDTGRLFIVQYMRGSDDFMIR